MSTADVPRSMSQRPVPFVARKDLVVQRVDHGQGWHWVLKDPLRNELFRLRPDQYALHQMLDGRVSVEDIRARMAQEFRELTMTAAQVQELVIDLFRKGLTVSTRMGQGTRLAERQRRQRRRRLFAAVQNPLFIRFPGWDPTRLLDRCAPWAARLFHPGAILLGVALILATWCFALVRFDDLTARLPPLERVAAGSSLLAMWLVLAVVKSLHELGHALACRRGGAECHEIGVALMMFSPSMYCDVSDAGRLPSRRQRMGVSAAGIYVELLLSSLAFVTWWNTREGVLHLVSWWVCVVSSVGVAAFNLNPLLRLDGYYMLSDWLGIPNLRQKAGRVAIDWLRWATLGAVVPADPTISPKQRVMLLCYAVAATAFQLQFLLVIVLVLHQALAPYELQAVGLLLGVAMTVIVGLRGAAAAARGWQRRHSGGVRGWRPRVTAVAVAAGLIAMWCVPFPTRVKAPLVVEPAAAQPVYVAEAGRLVAIRVRAGQRVQRGDVLLELVNEEAAEDLRAIHARYEMQRIAVSVEQALGDMRRAAVATSLRDSLYEELQDCRRRAARLTVTAPCDGIVIAPPPAARPRAARPRGIAGTPLDDANLGAFLPDGMHALTLAPSDEHVGVLLVDQLSSVALQPGCMVSIKLEHAPGEVIHGVAEAASPFHERASAAGDAFSSEKRAAWQAGSTSDAASHMVIRLKAEKTSIVPGLRGEARIVHWHPSFASWLWRQARTTFAFL